MDIKNRYNNSVIYSSTKDNIKDAVLEYIKQEVTAGRVANLRSANLSYANLRSANLSSADLRYADLSSANLSYANLSSADLRYADLSFTNLSYANLSSANLSYANLSYANLSYADLSYANLSYADLRSANLRSAKGLSKFLINPLQSLKDQVGLIRAYKVVNQNFTGPQYPTIMYNVGQEIKVDNWDSNEENNCGSGINVATVDWCLRNYYKDLYNRKYHLLLVEFTVKDIVAIPASDGKFRVKKCRVVKELDLDEYLPIVKEEIK